MPYVKTVSVDYERKINLGDYNAVTVGCHIWADVQGEELDSAMRALWTMAKENVRAQVAHLKGKQVVEVQEFFLGLPVEGSRRTVDPETGEVIEPAADEQEEAA